MRYLAIILFGILILGCGGSDKPTKPDNLISQDKMSDILFDVFILNAAKGINKRVLENNGVQPQEYVYKKYNIDSLQFALSNNYYAYDTKVYEGIMDKVKQKITAEKKLNDSISEKEEKVKDSLNKIKKQGPKSDSLPLLKPKMKAKTFVKIKN